ncbi:hypothetical protein GIB67_030122 [Kingdonia uniflora]|uniref:Uncharacterized protein n=1 Tax=Kingdonia uniflora TaxID=39325 RepID=A0A7J7L2P4_9MAGN|nr:hypothetical protein GIB67_030122 [Kingdonia uniflora]
MEDGLNVAEKTVADNLETINLREEQTLLYNAEYAEEYEALISQYEDRLDDNVKLSFKLEKAKRQVEDKTAIILSRDSALNQLTSELVELKENVASGFQHEAELTEYRIRELNEEIFDMKYNIRALNEQLLMREIDLDIARTNLAVSVADFEKLCSSIMGKDRELCNSAQICDSLIARLDRLKADLHYLKGREAQSRADLVEIQAKNKSLVDDLAHTRRNVRRVVQREKETNERINQLCARISESEQELRDNKRAAVTHQAFKDLVVHEQEKCDGEALHQRELSALVAFFVEEIKFLQVERDLMQDCFSGKTCVCKLDISSIDPIGGRDRGIGITTTEQIARGREIVAKRAPKYMASRTEVGGSSSGVSPTPVVGGRLTALPS